MTLPVPVDAAEVVRQLLAQADLGVVSDAITAEALSSPAYILVTENAGSVAHLRYSYQPQIDLVIYSSEGRAVARALAYKSLEVLRQAVVDGVKVPAGGLHSVQASISPYPQAIPGLPPGVSRVFCSVSLVVSNESHWA